MKSALLRFLLVLDCAVLVDFVVKAINLLALSNHPLPPSLFLDHEWVSVLQIVNLLLKFISFGLQPLHFVTQVVTLLAEFSHLQNAAVLAEDQVYAEQQHKPYSTQAQQQAGCDVKR